MALLYYEVQLNYFQCIKQRTKVNYRTPFPNGFAILRSTTDLVSVHKVENRSTISKRPCRVTECDYFVPYIKQHILEYIAATHNISKDRSLIKKYFFRTDPHFFKVQHIAPDCPCIGGTTPTRGQTPRYFQYEQRCGIVKIYKTCPYKSTFQKISYLGVD